MPDRDKELGKLVAVHGLEPAYLQRSVFIVVLSFLFFLAMMIMYYVRPELIYFLLSSAFLLLYLITLFSFVMQRRNLLKIFEGGISFRKQTALWAEISAVPESGIIELQNRKQIALPGVLSHRENVISYIRSRTGLTQ